ncbi:MAG: hypothetical protein LBD58_03335 [Treponema sp.]|jgi:hypothetical protein|nr:hypothetical protein [Treponema sp.]
MKKSPAVLFLLLFLSFPVFSDDPQNDLQNSVRAAASRLTERVRNEEILIGVDRLAVKDAQIDETLAEFLISEIYNAVADHEASYHIVLEYSVADISTASRRGGSGPSIHALIQGDISLIKDGVDVKLRLVSTINKAQLGSAGFAISDAALEEIGRPTKKAIPKTFALMVPANEAAERIALKVKSLLQDAGFSETWNNPGYYVTVKVTLKEEKFPAVFAIRPSIDIKIEPPMGANAGESASYSKTLPLSSSGTRLEMAQSRAYNDLEKDLEENFIKNIAKKLGL